MPTIMAGEHCRVKYTVTQDILKNTSVIKITEVAVNSSSYGGYARVQGTLVCAGETLISWDYGSMTSVSLGTAFAACTNVSGQKTKAIAHNADGTKTVSISVNFNFAGFQTGTSYGGASGSAKLSLPTIPRVSGITAEPGELGQGMKITLDRKADAYTDRVSWQCGSESGVISETGTDTEFLWIPPVALAAQEPERENVDIKVRVETFSGETAIGAAETVVTCRIPDSVVPSVRFSVTDKLGYTQTHGSYVQNQSRARVQSVGEGVYGSTIQRYTVTCGKMTAEGEDAVFSLPDAGLVAVRVTVTDSRGRTASAEESLPVQAWELPSVSIDEVYRCDSDGSRQADGAFAAIVFSSRVTELNSKNHAAYQLLRRARGSSYFEWTELPAFADDYALVKATHRVTASIEEMIEFAVNVQDDFGSFTSSVGVLPVAYAMIDLNRGIRSIGLGQRATAEQQLNIGLQTKHFGHRITDVGDPEGEQDAVTLGWVNRLADEIERTVNRRIAEITAEKIGAAQWKKLWENENKAAAFAAQTVAVDLTGYDMIAVEILAATDAPRCSIGLMNLHGSANADCMMTVLYGNRHYYRSVSIGDNGLDFAIGYYGPNYGSSGAASGAKYGIPQTIWGIRNVI